nr:crinkler 30 [Plasmopara viticola]
MFTHDDKFRSVVASRLKLSLAKKGAGWLPSAEFRAIRKGEDLPGFERVSLVDTEDELYSTYLIRDVLDTNKRPPPQTRQIYVLVVVPEQGSSISTVAQDGVFDHCSDPFFSQFSTADQVGDWLNFSSLLPLTSRQKLYIRSSYRVIADQALLNPDGNMVKHAVVTGTPGIGKSVFVYYVMWRLIKDKKRVLLFGSEGNFYFDGTTMFQRDSLPKKFKLQF